MAPFINQEGYLWEVKCLGVSLNLYRRCGFEERVIKVEGIMMLDGGCLGILC